MTRTALILTTIDQRDRAETLARTLVERRLAACVSLVGPIRSFYHWQGALEEADEFLLLIKRPAGEPAAFEAALRALHPYETPEIVTFDADHTSADYLAWVIASTQ